MSKKRLRVHMVSRREIRRAALEQELAQDAYMRGDTPLEGRLGGSASWPAAETGRDAFGTYPVELSPAEG